MEKNTEKPSQEAKALSLFFMAFKTVNPIYKEKSKRINRLWDLVKSNEMSKEDYQTELEKMIDTYGGYSAVVEKTVKYYIDKTGAWKSGGTDQYSLDAQVFADKIIGK